MLAPYQNSDERGAPQIAPEVLQQAMVAIDARGMHGFFHAIGDGAVRLSLDAIEAARKANGAKPTWHMVTHLNVVDPADQPRFARLSTFAQLQPTRSEGHTSELQSLMRNSYAVFCLKKKQTKIH